MIVLIFILKRLNIVLIIYLDNILLIAEAQEEMTPAKDTLIFLLQSLRFSLNIKRSVVQLCEKIEFLGMIVDLKEMTLSLSQEKVTAIIEQC